MNCDGDPHLVLSHYSGFRRLPLFSGAWTQPTLTCQVFLFPVSHSQWPFHPLLHRSYQSHIIVPPDHAPNQTALLVSSLPCYSAWLLV